MVALCTFTFTHNASKASFSRCVIRENGIVLLTYMATPPPFLVLVFSAGAWKPFKEKRLGCTVASTFISDRAKMSISLISTKCCNSWSRSGAVIELMLRAEMFMFFVLSFGGIMLVWRGSGMTLRLAASGAITCSYQYYNYSCLGHWEIFSLIELGTYLKHVT